MDLPDGERVVYPCSARRHEVGEESVPYSVKVIALLGFTAVVPNLLRDKN